MQHGTLAKLYLQRRRLRRRVYDHQRQYTARRDTPHLLRGVHHDLGLARSSARYVFEQFHSL